MILASVLGLWACHGLLGIRDVEDDAWGLDAGVLDAGVLDAGVVDAGVLDGRQGDTSRDDASASGAQDGMTDGQGPSPMPDAVFASCEEVKRMSPQAPSGTYRIRDPVDSASHYRAFCKFDSVGQAWTLVLKVDGYLHGTKDSETSRFFYDDPLWVDTEVYNEDSLNTDEREAKLLSYLKASVQFVRLEFVETNTSANVLDLDLGSRYANLRTVILRSPGPVDAGAVGLSTKAGKAQWLSLVAGATLQPFCLREGFSVIGADSTPSQFDRVRIGIVGNENGAGDCNSPNSYLGVGGLRGSEKACSPKSVPSRGVSAGFVGGIGVEDDGKAICAEAQPSRRAWSAAFAYVYVR